MMGGRGIETHPESLPGEKRGGYCVGLGEKVSGFSKFHHKVTPILNMGEHIGLVFNPFNAGLQRKKMSTIEK